MSAFLSMGGYWPFVWPAWGLAVANLAGLYVLSRARMRRAERLLESLGGRPARSGATLARPVEDGL